MAKISLISRRSKKENAPFTTWGIAAAIKATSNALLILLIRNNTAISLGLYLPLLISFFVFSAIQRASSLALSNAFTITGSPDGFSVLNSPLKRSGLNFINLSLTATISGILL